MQPCVPWRVVEQPTEQLSSGQPKQEHTEQPEQQYRLPGGAVLAGHANARAPELGGQDIAAGACAAISPMFVRLMPVGMANTSGPAVASNPSGANVAAGFFLFFQKGDNLI